MDEYYLEIKSGNLRLLKSINFKMKTRESAFRKAKEETRKIFSRVDYTRYTFGFAILWNAKKQSGEPIAKWILERKIEIKITSQ
ncbi:MAG: hypothetical protein AAB432_00040 [Patescibacteria group bacterium]